MRPVMFSGVVIGQSSDPTQPFWVNIYGSASEEIGPSEVRISSPGHQKMTLFNQDAAKSITDVADNLTSACLKQSKQEEIKAGIPTGWGDTEGKLNLTEILIAWVQSQSEQLQGFNIDGFKAYLSKVKSLSGILVNTDAANEHCWGIRERRWDFSLAEPPIQASVKPTRRPQKTYSSRRKYG